MVLISKWSFFELFFLGKIGQKNIFYDILERIKAFQGYEKKKLKKSNNWHYFNGVNPWFWYQNDHFSNFFFLGKIGQKNVFYDILERIKAFPGYENKKLKQSKNWHFSKGVNPWFWYKNSHFWNFFLRENRPGKCLLLYSRTNKGLFRIWKQEVEKLEKLTFYQRG